jgi:hypothetical protein
MVNGPLLQSPAKFKIYPTLRASPSYPPREEQRRYRCKSGRTIDPNQRKGQLKGKSASSLSHSALRESRRAPAISAVISRCHSRSARRATKLSRARATLQEEVPSSSYHVLVADVDLGLAGSQNLVRTPKARLVAHRLRSRCAEALLLPRCTPTIARGRS